ncbi:MAG: dynamin family protein [Pseudomonadota bacterium]
MQDAVSGRRSASVKSPGKPCVALMGEFSAGKSTLLNLLLARDPLPVRVTASSVPPVWISHGPEAAIRVAKDGTETEIGLDEISETTLSDADFVRLWLTADALEICDLIDMPGISDPNMSGDTWTRLIEVVDSVIWCTHATQAWRQSEASTWDAVRSDTNGRNLLVVTQFDKITSERDRKRLLGRLEKETKGLFQGVFPVALIDAIRAQNETQWRASGAADFSEKLVDLLLRDMDKPLDTSAREARPAVERPSPPARPHPGKTASDDRVVPRRIHSAPDRSMIQKALENGAES